MTRRNLTPDVIRKRRNWCALEAPVYDIYSKATGTRIGEYAVFLGMLTERGRCGPKSYSWHAPDGAHGITDTAYRAVWALEASARRIAKAKG